MNREQPFHPSPRLASIGYDMETMKMEVEFPNTKAPNLEGSVYIYHDVPPEVHAELMNSKDPGQYFADNLVKDRKAPAYKYDLVSKAKVADLNDPGLPKVKKEGIRIVSQGPITVVEEELVTRTPAEVDAAARASVAAQKGSGLGGLIGVGTKGRKPSFSITCEEASPVSTTAYIPCAKPAVTHIYHMRDNLTLAVCAPCADHNVRNRGAEYLNGAPEQAAAPKVELLAPGTPLPTNYDDLLVHVTTVKAQIQGLIKQEGVKVQLVVTTPAAYQKMAETFVALSKEKKEAQAWCDADRKPHNEAYKSGLQREKDIMAGYGVLDLLDKALTAYREAEKAERRAAELKAQREEQARLDKLAQEQAAAARLQAEKEAKVMEAVGQPEVANIIRNNPAPVVAETARPIVYATETPKVEGLAERGTWKNMVENAALIPLFFRDRIRQAISDEVSRAPDEALDDTRMTRLTLTIATILGDFYSLDQAKINGFIKPKKEAGINLVPGLKVWFDAKTSTTGR